ncbi:MAG: thioredoxin family protein [Reichenbachiella sp.]
MNKSIFYHAGCPVCITAENELISLLDSSQVEIVHLGEDQSRIDEAESKGIKSVPALLSPNSQVLHINFGASLNEVRN